MGTVKWLLNDRSKISRVNVIRHSKRKGKVVKAGYYGYAGCYAKSSIVLPKVGEYDEAEYCMPYALPQFEDIPVRMAAAMLWSPREMEMGVSLGGPQKYVASIGVELSDG